MKKMVKLLLLSSWAALLVTLGELLPSAALGDFFGSELHEEIRRRAHTRASDGSLNIVK